MRKSVIAVLPLALLLIASGHLIGNFPGFWIRGNGVNVTNHIL